MWNVGQNMSHSIYTFSFWLFDYEALTLMKIHKNCLKLSGVVIEYVQTTKWGSDDVFVALNTYFYRLLW